MADLLDTVLTVAWALAGWIVFLATVAAVLVTAAAVTGAWAVRGAWRWLRARMPRHGAPRGLGAPQGPSCGSSDAGEAERPPGGRVRPSWSVGGVRPSAGARRVLGAPLVDGGFGPQGGASDLLRLREVGNPVRQVVDALAIDTETRRDLVGREVAGDLHVSTIAPLSSPSTASIGVVELLQWGGLMARSVTNWTDSQKWMLAAETGFACAYCQIIFGSAVRRPGYEPVIVRLEVDHFQPVSWTGREADAENYVAACQICNRLKHDDVFDSIINARRNLDRRWVSAGYVVEFVPTRSHFEDPDGWAKEYSRYLRTIGVRQDAD